MAVQGSGRAPDPKIPVSPPDPHLLPSTMPGTQRALGLRPACLLPGSAACAPRSGPQLSGAPDFFHGEEALLSPGPAPPHPCDIGLTPSDRSCLGGEKCLSPAARAWRAAACPQPSPGSSHGTCPELLHVLLTQGRLLDLGGSHSKAGIRP